MHTDHQLKTGPLINMAPPPPLHLPARANWVTIYPTVSTTSHRVGGGESETTTILFQHMPSPARGSEIRTKQPLTNTVSHSAPAGESSLHRYDCTVICSSAKKKKKLNFIINNAKEPTWLLHMRYVSPPGPVHLHEPQLRMVPTMRFIWGDHPYFWTRAADEVSQPWALTLTVSEEASVWWQIRPQLKLLFCVVFFFFNEDGSTLVICYAPSPNQPTD